MRNHFWAKFSFSFTIMDYTRPPIPEQSRPLIPDQTRPVNLVNFGLGQKNESDIPA